MDGRQVVTVGELVSFINGELEARGQDIRVDAPIHLLEEPDEDGCNWSDTLAWRLGESGEKPMRALDEVVGEARRRFNLRETGRVVSLKGSARAHFYLEERPVHGPAGGPWRLVCEVVPAQVGAGPGPKIVRGGTRDDLKRYVEGLTAEELRQLVDRVLTEP